MPAIKLFGRKWLAATDDLVYPGFFEIFVRAIWLCLIVIASVRYYEYTWSCQLGGELVRVYLLGEVAFLAVSILFMLIVIKLSSKGSIMETHARKYVEPLLTVKILFLLPEISWNILGSLWLFGPYVKCDYEHYTMKVTQALVVFDWILIGLAILGLLVIFDPLGSLSNKHLENLDEHGKILKIWQRRFKFLWWMRKDENCSVTFQYVAGLLTTLFRGTDLIPSDVMAGLILLRVQQKRETHELRQRNFLPVPKYTSNAAVIFENTPSWMTLKNASHYMKLSIACYGWLLAMYLHIYTGWFRVLSNMTCCACFRRKRTLINGDNCCYCYLAGIKSLSNISTDDILYASFKNYLCEIPFCVITDKETNNIVIIVRGSLSLRDIITDITADSEVFICEGVPLNAQAHRSMITAARIILKQLDDNKVLERAFNTYPHYNLVLTGHSLGAGISILLAFLLRPRYPSLKVYAFATPAGLLSRELARITEEFVFTVGVGDDFVMRLSVESTENLRTSLLRVLHACRLPKYRVVLNGLGYMLFGIPEKDLEKTWNIDIINTVSGATPLLNNRNLNSIEENRIYERDVTKRRYSKVRLYIGGRILHIVRCKPESSENESKKQNKEEQKFEMRWAQPEEFSELLVMPRMLLDHLPENIDKTITTLLEQQK
ncbi:diacylglycerol lipase-beta-like isoform X2 [Frieseomelitta varia]|nr:diacylglycerol lipase-beta-like isoform X2 [Frieseomelitta varia]XP_043519403.1 diacylglycerol lipase-beta-like isoform X2 [Frieseomelitta varia]XP_043519404.1 diacylglycerol lipase-beta-like isoform X2 [Frieseomelitta varia]